MSILTKESLMELLNYDESSGVFISKITRGRNAVAGKEVGTINNNGYVRIRIYGKTYQGHRLAWLYFYGEWPVNCIDHKNGIRYDNRICNLREATKSQNGRNKGKNSNNTSGYKGVSLDKRRNKWGARIKTDNKYKHIGYFDDPCEASLAYQEASLKYHGEFSCNAA